MKPCPEWGLPVQWQVSCLSFCNGAFLPSCSPALSLPLGSTLFSPALGSFCPSRVLASSISASLLQDCCVGKVTVPSGYPLLPLPGVHSVASASVGRVGSPDISGWGGVVSWREGAGGAEPPPSRLPCCPLVCEERGSLCSGVTVLILDLTDVITHLHGAHSSLWEPHQDDASCGNTLPAGLGVWGQPLSVRLAP